MREHPWVAIWRGSVVGADERECNADDLAGQSDESLDAQAPVIMVVGDGVSRGDAAGRYQRGTEEIGFHAVFLVFG